MSGLYFSLPLNVRATLLIQNRWPVGSGPSSNTWPRWASHCQDTYKKNHYTKITYTEEKKKLGTIWQRQLKKLPLVVLSWRHFNASKANMNFVWRFKLGRTYIFTEDLCPRTTKAVVRATNNGGVAFILLPCPMSLFEWRPACPGVVLWLWTKSRHTSLTRQVLHSGRSWELLTFSPLIPEKWSFTADTVVHPHFRMVKVDPTEGLKKPTMSGGGRGGTLKVIINMYHQVSEFISPSVW